MTSATRCHADTQCTVTLIVFTCSTYSLLRTWVEKPRYMRHPPFRLRSCQDVMPLHRLILAANRPWTSLYNPRVVHANCSISHQLCWSLLAASLDSMTYFQFRPFGNSVPSAWPKYVEAVSAFCEERNSVSAPLILKAIKERRGVPGAPRRLRKIWMQPVSRIEADSMGPLDGDRLICQVTTSVTPSVILLHPMLELIYSRANPAN